jgi:hypothetical protein
MALGSPVGTDFGRLFCQTYATYRTLVTTPTLSFDHACLLLTLLHRADELQTTTCVRCRGLMVSEVPPRGHGCCAACAAPTSEPSAAASPTRVE